LSIVLIDKGKHFPMIVQAYFLNLYSQHYAPILKLICGKHPITPCLLLSEMLMTYFK